MENKAKKASNEQKMYLVEYMENNIEFANDRFESVDGAHLRAQKSSDLAATLNGLGGAVKDATKWRKYWSDQKSHIKEREILRRASLQQTGRNGLGRSKEATDFEKRVLQLMAPVVVTGHDNVPEMINLTHHEEDMQLEFLESDTEGNNTERVLPAAAPQRPPTLPRPPSPPQSSSMLRSSAQKRKRTTGSNSSVEAQYLEIEKKKIRLMEENNRLLREKNELEKQKHEAEIKWRDRQYEIELRRLEIMERQATFQNDNYIA